MPLSSQLVCRIALLAQDDVGRVLPIEAIKLVVIAAIAADERALDPDERIVARTAMGHVVAQPVDQHIRTKTAPQDVVAFAAGNHVIAPVPRQQIVVSTTPS